MTRRAGLYLRISQDPSGDHLAVQRQEEDGHLLIGRRGWELVDTYTDNDISARGRKKRPEFLRLMADVRNGHVDTIVAERWDRLSRFRRDALTIVEACQPRGVLLSLMKGSDVDLATAAGRLVGDMFAAQAVHEIDQKSERQVREAQQRAERGLPGSVGRRAFGYTADGLHLDPIEATVLRQMYDRWLTGESMGSMAAWLNRNNVRTPRGNTWSFQSVREVLANPRNGGLRGIRDVVNPKTGTRAQWHRIVGPAVWPGAVTEETWRAALARIHDPDRPGQHVGVNGQKHLLTGIATCGVCGRTLITGGGKNERLRCPALKHIGRRADLIEAYVEESVLAYFKRTALLPSPDGQTDAVDLDAIRSESIELRARLNGLARDYADGILDRNGVKTAGDRLRARLLELDRQVVAAGQVDVAAPLRAAADPSAVWDEMPIATRREVVRRVVSVVVLNGRAGRPGGLRFQPDTVRLTWNE